MRYVDGYVLPAPEKNLDAYRRMARKTARIWRDHGALDYHECAGEVVFAWIVFKSRAHRDRVNARVMKDPRLAAMGSAESMPFDSKRMVYGGFQTIVSL